MDDLGLEHIAVSGDVIANTTAGTTVALQKGDGSGGLTDYSHSFGNLTPTIVTGTGATGTQLSATNDVQMNYSVTIATTATIGGGASGTVVLEICSTNSATPASWIEIARVTNGQVITLAIALQSVQTTAGGLSGILPLGFYRKIRSINNTGTPTFTSNPGQEVII